LSSRLDTTFNWLEHSSDRSNAFEALSGMIAGTKYEIRTRFMIE